MSLNSNFRIHSYIDKKDFCELKKTFAKNLEFQNQKTGFKNVAVLEKEEKKII